MGGLIGRSLSETAPPGEVCPTPEVFAAYYEHSLDSTEIAQFETHLSRCAGCREQLAIMVRAEEKPQPLSPQHAWWRDWRLLAPAAATLLILVLWGFRRPLWAPAISRDASQPLVVMSQPPQAPALEVPQPHPSPQTPPTARPETNLIAPQAADRVIAPKEQSQQRTAAPENDKQLQPPVLDKQLSNLPVNGRELESVPQPKSSNDANIPADLKKGSPSEAAPPAAGASVGALSFPPALTAPTAANPATRSATAPANQFPDDKSKAADSSRAKQGAPRRMQALGPAAGSTVAQLAGQRSGSTIIQTPDPKVLWRIATGNFIERTEDGGATWHGQVADPDAELSSGSAPGLKVCWLVGRSGMILLTKDTTHWKKIPPPVPADFVAIEAKSGRSATVTAADGQKFSTDNEGKKWVPAK